MPPKTGWKNETGYRPYLLPDGTTKMIYVGLCVCPDDKRRGPSGGVCGACGGAIPKEDDKT